MEDLASKLDGIWLKPPRNEVLNMEIKRGTRTFGRLGICARGSLPENKTSLVTPSQTWVTNSLKWLVGNMKPNPTSPEKVSLIRFSEVKAHLATYFSDGVEFGNS